MREGRDAWGHSKPAAHAGASCCLPIWWMAGEGAMETREGQAEGEDSDGRQRIRASPMHVPQIALRMKTHRKNPVPSCPYFYIYPARFRIYGKIQKWDGKREEVYPARICGIPFLAGIIPYFSRIYKIWKKINRHTIYPLMFLNINTYSSTLVHVLHVGNKKH